MEMEIIIDMGMDMAQEMRIDKTEIVMDRRRRSGADAVDGSRLTIAWWRCRTCVYAWTEFHE